MPYKKDSEVTYEFDRQFDWKDCGSFLAKDEIIRPCYECGFDTQFCANCTHDHHVVDRDDAIKERILNLRRLDREAIMEYVRGMFYKITPIEEHWMYGGTSKTATEIMEKQKAYDKEMLPKRMCNNLLSDFLQYMEELQ
jgi:hypothetical protein